MAARRSSTRHPIAGDSGGGKRWQDELLRLRYTSYGVRPSDQALGFGNAAPP